MLAFLFFFSRVALQVVWLQKEAQFHPVQQDNAIGGNVGSVYKVMQRKKQSSIRVKKNFLIVRH